MASKERLQESVNFCNDCPFANRVQEAPVDSVKIMTAYGDYYDSEGRRSLTFTDENNVTKAVYVNGGS
jgi:hypothetical protein